MIGDAANADHRAIKARRDRTKIAVHCGPMGRVRKKEAPFFG